MRTSKTNWLGLLAFQAAALAFGGCFQWQFDVTKQGVAVSRVRVEDDGLVSGELKADTVIGGRPCRKGWVHILPSGVPVGFTASKELDLGRLKIPANTWVFQNKDGVVTVCAFPEDIEVQGRVCRGSGGPKGVQTAFYPDGSLKEFFLTEDTRIDGIPCKAGIFDEAVMLYENGSVKRCVLSGDYVQDGRMFPAGTQLGFDPAGRAIPRQG